VKRFICLWLLIASLPLFGASLQLKNDSVVELTATILTASGSELDSIQLQPGEFKIWSTDLSTSPNIEKFFRANWSITPFTVIWRCPDGGVYSMCSDAGAGAYVSARSCPGAKECKPPPQKKEGYQQSQR
jgi:hypothetical protein